MSELLATYRKQPAGSVPFHEHLTAPLVQQLVGLYAREQRLSPEELFAHVAAGEPRGAFQAHLVAAAADTLPLQTWPA